MELLSPRRMYHARITKPIATALRAKQKILILLLSRTISAIIPLTARIPTPIPSGKPKLSNSAPVTRATTEHITRKTNEAKDTTVIFS